MIFLTNPKQILLKAKSAFPCVHAPSKLPPPGYVVRLTAYHSTKVQSFQRLLKNKNNNAERSDSRVLGISQILSPLQYGDLSAYWMVMPVARDW
jgi:hypothetical protein